MTPRRFRKGGIVLRFLLAIVLLIALGAGAAYFSLTIPYRGFAKPVILDFPRGTSTAEMANQLAQSGVIRYPWQFKFPGAPEPGHVSDHRQRTRVDQIELTYAVQLLRDCSHLVNPSCKKWRLEP